MSKAIVLADGCSMPLVGLGTARLKRGWGRRAIEGSIQLGVRHFDCAKLYGNEVMVGEVIAQALRDGHVKRDDIFVTSKVWNDDHRPEHVVAACRESLNRLGLKYLDLYLVHWPQAWRKGTVFCPDNVPISDTWRAMEGLVDAGLVRSIGVSNFDKTNLSKLLATARRRPVVNQIETHPYLVQQDLVDFCQAHGIVVTAWSPLAKANSGLLTQPALISISRAHGRTVSQIILRWNIQRGVSVIPRSANAKHIEENLNVFDFKLSAQEMRGISDLDRHKRSFPDLLGVFDDSPLFFHALGAVIRFVMWILWTIIPIRVDLKFRQ
eukprot:c8259_g1_i1.p1 GENE.c8259_g1_i1~~c8259_g1_i1.p1  ORF type:complete len:332 (+),score=49.39 c8259_g1_i1:28-996(+)